MERLVLGSTPGAAFSRTRGLAQVAISMKFDIDLDEPRCQKKFKSDSHLSSDKPLDDADICRNKRENILVETGRELQDGSDAQAKGGHDSTRER